MAGNAYHANFRAQRKRDSSFPDSVLFGAVDDTAAAAIFDLMAVAGSGYLLSQGVSLTKRLQDGTITPHDLGAAHPVGTRLGMTALLQAADQSIWRVRLRNLKTSVDPGLVSNLLLGTADGGAVLTALSAPPKLPNSNQTVTQVNYTIIEKP